VKTIGFHWARELKNIYRIANSYQQ